MASSTIRPANAAGRPDPMTRSPRDSGWTRPDWAEMNAPGSRISAGGSMAQRSNAKRRIAAAILGTALALGSAGPALADSFYIYRAQQMNLVGKGDYYDLILKAGRINFAAQTVRIAVKPRKTPSITVIVYRLDGTELSRTQGTDAAPAVVDLPVADPTQEFQIRVVPTGGAFDVPVGADFRVPLSAPKNPVPLGIFNFVVSDSSAIAEKLAPASLPAARIAAVTAAPRPPRRLRRLRQRPSRNWLPPKAFLGPTQHRPPTRSCWPSNGARLRNWRIQSGPRGRTKPSRSIGKASASAWKCAVSGCGGANRSHSHQRPMARFRQRS